jgi:transcriptional regulator with PAS, ATPase and Fis domain
MVRKREPRNAARPKGIIL